MTRWLLGQTCVAGAILCASVLANDRDVSWAESPIGWASIDGGTTGGKSGEQLTVGDAAALHQAVRGDTPRTIVIRGTLELSDSLRVGSNKTLLGEANATLVGRGIQLRKVHNVVIRNLTIRDSADDAINLEEGTHHVWIDHCDLAHCHDGLLDIKRASDLVTVSWCRFRDHHKTCLLGHSDKADVLAQDRGKLRVTYHHNFFDRTDTRHPRVRAAETVHVFNNYYLGNEYGVASTNDAGVLVEGNAFVRVKHPTFTKYGDSKVPGRLVARENLTTDSGMLETAGEVRPVPYKYRLDPADSIPTLVAKHAGVVTQP